MTEKNEKLKLFVEAESAKHNLTTGKQIAEFASVSEATIQRIRMGKGVKTGTACQIAAAFGKTLEDALGDDAEPICVGEDILPVIMDNFSAVFREYRYQSEQTQEKLKSALELIKEKDDRIAHLEEENKRVVREYNKARIWSVACAVAVCTLLVVIIAILIYDFTHLDRGWITSFFDKTARMVIDAIG